MIQQEWLGYIDYQLIHSNRCDPDRTFYQGDNCIVSYKSYVRHPLIVQMSRLESEFILIEKCGLDRIGAGEYGCAVIHQVKGR